MNSSSFSKPVSLRLMRLSFRMVAVLAFLAFISGARAIEITPTFDSSITSLSYGNDVVLTIRAAVFEYRYRIKESTAASITFKYDDSIGAAGDSTKEVVRLDYADYRTLLSNSSSGSNLDVAALNSLPASDNPVRPGNGIYVQHALARALGYPSVPVGTDSIVRLKLGTMKVGPTWTFTGVARTSLYSVVCHEMNHVLGLGVGFDAFSSTGSIETAIVEPCDLFRYDQNGQRSRTLSSSAEAYFLIPGFGRIVRVNQTNGGDYSDWYKDSSTPARVQNWQATDFEDPRLSDPETNALDAIGYTILPTPCWIDLSIGDDSNGGNYGGGYFYPYQTVTKADANIGSGGAIMVVATGNQTMHTNRISVTTPCKIVPFNGTLRIAP